jgi:hypothetical protein
VERPAGICPPHHWTVTVVRIGEGTYYHHACVRCDAQKDLPLHVVSGGWRPERYRGLATELRTDDR